MPVSTAGALVFPLLMIKQLNIFSFWNILPNKSQDLSKRLVFSLFYVTKCLFFLSLLWNSTPLSKNQWLISYQIPLIARQPIYHRFYALVDMLLYNWLKIRLNWRCDGDSDCDDGSDEHDCKKECSSSQFLSTLFSLPQDYLVLCSDLHYFLFGTAGALVVITV